MAIDQQNSQDQDQFQDQDQSGGSLDTLRGSVIGVLDSVVREYEPQIVDFTSNIAHQAIDRGVELAKDFASTASERIQKQSWLRLGLAAALGVGAIAALTYEASELASASKEPKRTRRSAAH